MNINQLPTYIKEFLQTNMAKLMEIYNNGINENNEGQLVMKCNEKDNKMDVFFLTHILIQEHFPDVYTKIKDTQQKLIIIQDLELQSIFLVYI